MPKAWTDKDERQYQHIEKSLRERGRKRAKEVAARTVNKQRRQRGETLNDTTLGTGNPNLPLEERSRDELYNRAKQLAVRGRGRMNKDALIRAIRAAA